MSSHTYKKDDIMSIWSDSDDEIRPMSIRKRRLYESDEESSLSSINLRLLQTKKRIRILELTDSTTDEDNVTNFGSNFKNNNQKIRKSKRNKGEKYYTKTGNIIPAKKFENKDCKCVKMCKNRITERDQISLFNFCVENGDFNRQNTFLYASSQLTPIKRRRARNFKGSAPNKLGYSCIEMSSF